jgi:hypothetical protein
MVDTIPAFLFQQIRGRCLRWRYRVWYFGGDAEVNEGGRID